MASLLQEWILLHLSHSISRNRRARSWLAGPHPLPTDQVLRCAPPPQPSRVLAFTLFLKGCRRTLASGLFRGRRSSKSRRCLHGPDSEPARAAGHIVAGWKPLQLPLATAPAISPARAPRGGAFSCKAASVLETSLEPENSIPLAPPKDRQGREASNSEMRLFFFCPGQ